MAEGVAVRMVDLRDPVPPLADVREHDRVRVYAFLDDQILGVSPANADGLVRTLTARFVAGLRAARLS